MTYKKAFIVVLAVLLCLSSFNVYNILATVEPKIFYISKPNTATIVVEQMLVVETLSFNSDYTQAEITIKNVASNAYDSSNGLKVGVTFKQSASPITTCVEQTIPDIAAGQVSTKISVPITWSGVKGIGDADEGLVTIA